MKCPKCGFQSFNHLTACKKCGRDLTDQQEKLGFDYARWQSAPAPARQPEADSPPDETVQEPGGLEESLDDFFQSFESPPETSAAEETHLPTESPVPTEEMDHADAPLDPIDETFSFEETDDLFSFDDLDAELSGPGDLEEPEEEIGESNTATGLPGWGNDPEPAFEPEQEPGPALDEPESEPVAKDLSQPAEDFFGASPEEEENFFSFADLEAELEAVPAPDGGLSLDAGPVPAWEPAEEPLANGFVSPREIEQAMVEDAAAKAAAVRSPADSPLFRAELEQGEFPLAGDGLQQETPDTDEEESRPSSILGLRLLAVLTDLGILTMVFAAFVLAGEMMRSPDRADWFRLTPNALLELAIPYFLVLFILCFGYFTLFHFLTGQTPGKMLWRVRVEGETGDPLSLAQAFLHTAGGLLALLPAGLGFLSIMANRSRRGWNDRLANSRVVAALPERH